MTLANTSKPLFNSTTVSLAIEQLKNEMDGAYHNSISNLVNSASHQLNSITYHFNSLLNCHKPKAILTCNDFSMEGRLVTKLALLNKIPTFYLQHGNMAGNLFASTHIADHILVFGDSTRDLLIKEGIQSNKIIVTGAPYLDSHPLSATAEQKRKVFGDTNKIKCLVGLSGPGINTSYNHYQKILQAIFQLGTQNQAIYFTFKLHQKDSKKNFSTVVKEFPKAKVKILDLNDQKKTSKTIFDWIQSADFVLTGASTVAIESMYLKKPTLTLDLENEYAGVDFIQSGATFHATSYNELVHQVDSIIEKKGGFHSIMAKAKEFVNYYYLKEEKMTASQHCAMEILKVTELCSA